jgi:hypothetical protein
MSTQFQSQQLRIASTLLLALILSVLAVGALTVGARARRKSTTGRPIAASAPTVPAQRRRQIAQLESELITITPHGFEPREISQPHGRFLLMVDNRSGLAVTTLELTREHGVRTHQMNLPREEPNWSQVVDLQPGRYVLTEVGHPNWSCLITITPQ